MTNNDKKLIALSEALDSRDWGIAYSYAEQADSIEAKEILKNIAVRLYHSEEYLADSL